MTARGPARRKSSGDGGSFLWLKTSLGSDIVVHWDVVLQVERGDTANRDVDLHSGAERAGGVRVRGAPPGQRRQHGRHLPAQTGAGRGLVCSVFSRCPTLAHPFWKFSNYGLLCSLVLSSLTLCPHPLLAIPIPGAPWCVLPTLPPPTPPPSAGSFPEGAGHGETRAAFRDTAAHGRSHPVCLHRLRHCQVHQAAKRAGQLPGETRGLRYSAARPG